MKKQIVIMLLLAISVTTFSQSIDSLKPFTNSDYLKKSKRQQNAAWIFAGGGAVLLGTGLAIGLRDASDALLGLFEGETESPSATGEILFYTGTASLLASIPLFIAASKNKRKANDVLASFKFENRQTIQNSTFIKSSYPAIVLKVKL